MSEINTVWNALRAILQNNFSFYEIKEIVALAGFDVTTIAHLEQKAGGGASKGQLMTGIDKRYAEIPVDEKRHFINIAIEEVIKRKPGLEENLENYLSRLGWTVVNGTVIPIEVFDAAELPELPEEAKTDLVKAAGRFRDGDLSGAISSACGAVDSVTSKIYVEKDLGDVGKASFQERCKISIKKSGIFSNIERELKELGWEESAISLLLKNYEGALNQAAFVMQKLRSGMSDVHGTKPSLRPLVYDSIKWAMLLVRVLNEK